METRSQEPLRAVLADPTGLVQSCLNLTNEILLLFSGQLLIQEHIQFLKDLVTGKQKYIDYCGYDSEEEEGEDEDEDEDDEESEAKQEQEAGDEKKRKAEVHPEAPLSKKAKVDSTGTCLSLFPFF